MIDFRAHRGKYVITPVIPVDTVKISFEVYVAGVLTFVGQTQYFGGTYEIDCRDWIDAYLAKATTDVMTLTIQIDFIFYDEDGNSSTSTKTLTWTPDYINLSVPNQNYNNGTYCNIELINCGFRFNGVNRIRVPLWLDDLTLVGKTINNLEKVTYIDKYGDTHNGSLQNRYELECYIDPCWFQVKTNSDLEYEKVILALQGAQSAVLKGCGKGGFDPILISGMDTIYVDPVPGGTRPLQYFEINGRVKDVKKIETYSSYSSKKKVPTLKIVFEIFYK